MRPQNAAAHARRVAGLEAARRNHAVPCPVCERPAGLCCVTDNGAVARTAHAERVALSESAR